MRSGVRRGRLSVLRLVALLVLAVLVAPGTWLHSPVADGASAAVTIRPLPVSTRSGNGLRVQGLWELQGAGETFGGYSAMLILEPDGLQLLSDRNYLLTLPRPAAGQIARRDFTARRLVPATRSIRELFDIESVTRSPDTGQFWVGYENRHTIYRYSPAGEPEAFVEPAYAADWAANGGIEALVRLADGRFVALREYGGDAYVYPGDPVEGTRPLHATVSWPDGYSPTDAAELPDGRLIVVLRQVGWHLPVFASRLALLDPAQFVPGQAWRPQMLAQLETLLPRDNWEAVAVDPVAGSASGAPVSLWLASDDNRSVFQRSLLARLTFVPPPRQAGRRP